MFKLSLPETEKMGLSAQSQFSTALALMLVAALTTMIVSGCGPRDSHLAEAPPQAPVIEGLSDQRQPTLPAGQVELGRAMDARRGVRHLIATNLVVTQVLPDDVHGRRHQKWVVALADQRRVQVVYNSEFGPRVPVVVGQIQSVAGEYIWNSKGGLLHWTHYDPRGRRPDGYVEVNGQMYGDDPPHR